MNKINKHVTYSSCFNPLKTVDMHKTGASNRFNQVLSNVSGETMTIDAHHWLPLAAKEYDISKDIKDYVIIAVPTIISDLPNTNGVAFTFDELLKFRTSLGMPAYKSFRGKPTFSEHSNSVIKDAKGIILDSILTPLNSYGKGLAKVVMLLAFDRNKDRELANGILKSKNNAYSMGAYFEDFSMSDGSRPTQQMLDTPLIINKKGELLYKKVHDITGFECSSVKNPAFISAISDNVLNF